MSEERRICRVTVPAPKDCTLPVMAGLVEIEVAARSLFEAAGLAIAEFRRYGLDVQAVMSITVSTQRVQVVDPAQFWHWLHREQKPKSLQEREIRDMLRDLLEVPLSREEKRLRQRR